MAAKSTQTLLHRQQLSQSLPKAQPPIRRMNRRPFDPTRKDSVLSRTASHGYLLLQFTQRCLSQNDRSGFPQLLRDEGITVRVVAFKQDRAECRRHSFYIKLILDDDRNAMKRAGKTRSLECRIQAVRLFKRLWIDCDDRIDSRPLLVVRVDPLQIKLDELMRGRPSGLVSVLNGLDCGFLKAERLSLARGFAGP